MVYLGIGVLDALHGYPTRTAMAPAFNYVSTLVFTRPLARGIAKGCRRGEWAGGGCGDTFKYAPIGEEHEGERVRDIP